MMVLFRLMAAPKHSWPISIGPEEPGRVGVYFERSVLMDKPYIA